MRWRPPHEPIARQALAEQTIPRSRNPNLHTGPARIPAYASERDDEYRALYGTIVAVPIQAPIVGDAFVCNIGDCLMRWTIDIYVSTPHRVASPGGRDRLSIAFFLDPNPDAVVECLPRRTGPDRPPRYLAITGAEYLRERLDATYAHHRAG